MERKFIVSGATSSILCGIQKLFEHYDEISAITDALGADSPSPEFEESFEQLLQAEKDLLTERIENQLSQQMRTEIIEI